MATRTIVHWRDKILPRLPQKLVPLARRLRGKDWLTPTHNGWIPDTPPGWENGPPEFVGVAAQKAGTSWWFTALSEHPQVFHHPKLPKELHFFEEQWQEPLRQEQLAIYSKMFPRPKGHISGEWSPDYALRYWVPECLSLCAPATKILMILRDPVARFLSGMRHDFAYGAPRSGIVAQQNFDRGLYGEQLNRLLRHFSRDRILVLQYEACKADPLAQFRRTVEFLELELVVPESLTHVVNESVGPKFEVEPAVTATLSEAYSPDVEQLLTMADLDLGLWTSLRYQP